MLLDDIKKKVDERASGQIREIEQAIASITETQHEHPSVANELMLRSLRYRKQKVEREATGVINRE